MKIDTNDAKNISETINTEENIETMTSILSEDGTYHFENDNLIVSVTVPSNVVEVRNYGDEQIQRFVDSREGLGNIETTASFPWNLDISYKTYESDTIISYVVQVYEYTGGAHGNTVLKSFNYDKKTGDKIGITDIVTNEDTFNTLANLADKELIIDYPEGSNKNPENWSVWYADNSSITFIFMSYQIASYAVGQQELKVPTTELEYVSLFQSKYFK